MPRARVVGQMFVATDPLREEIRDQAAALRGRDETLVTTRGRSDRATDLAVKSRSGAIRVAAHRKVGAQVRVSLVVIGASSRGAVAAATHYFPNKGGEWFGIAVALRALLAPIPFWLYKEVARWRATVADSEQTARIQIESELDTGRKQ